MENILWTPDHPEKSQMAQFIHRVNEIYGLEIKSYDELFNWSVNHISEFWEQIWDFSEIKHSIPYTEVVDDDKKMPGAKWFSGAKLNYAENLLRYRDDHPAIHFKGEGQPVRLPGAPGDRGARAPVGRGVQIPRDPGDDQTARHQVQRRAHGHHKSIRRAGASQRRRRHRAAGDAAQ